MKSLQWVWEIRERWKFRSCNEVDKTVGGKIFHRTSHIQTGNDTISRYHIQQNDHLTSLHMLLDNSSLTTREVTVCSLIMIMLVTAIPPSNPVTSSSAYHKHLQTLDLKLTCHPAKSQDAIYQMFKWTERNREFPKWVCVGLSKMGVWGFVVVLAGKEKLS